MTAALPRSRSLAVTALTLVLVVATAAAFVWTQVLKAQRPAVRPLGFDELVMPGCDCDRATATLPIRLGRAQAVDAAIVDADERPVRTLARDQLRGSGATSFLWSGRDDAGAVVPDGEYRLRLELSEPERSIVIPRPIRVEAARAEG